MSLLYLDTNIIIDAAEGRKNKFGKTIGNPASDLLLASAMCNHDLIISSWTVEELSKDRQNFTMLFNVIKKKIKKAFYTEEEKEKAKEQPAHLWKDALHIIIAEKEKADYIVTRNVDDFLMVGTNIPVRKPEQLLQT
jgi:predicted nucleic acid-binding protein